MIVLFTLGSFIAYGALVAGLSISFCKPTDRPRYMVSDSKSARVVRLNQKAYA